MSYDPAEQLDHGGMIFPGRHVLPNYNPGNYKSDIIWLFAYNTFRIHLLTFILNLTFLDTLIQTILPNHYYHFHTHSHIFYFIFHSRPPLHHFSQITDPQSLKRSPNPQYPGNSSPSLMWVSLSCIMSYCAVVCYAVVCCDVMCYAMLCYAVLYCAVLYCAVLCFLAVVSFIW